MLFRSTLTVVIQFLENDICPLKSKGYSLYQVEPPHHEALQEGLVLGSNLSSLSVVVRQLRKYSIVILCSSSAESSGCNLENRVFLTKNESLNIWFAISRLVGLLFWMGGFKDSGIVPPDWYLILHSATWCPLVGDFRTTMSFSARSHKLFLYQQHPLAFDGHST